MWTIDTHEITPAELGTWLTLLQQVGTPRSAMMVYLASGYGCQIRPRGGRTGRRGLDRDALGLAPPLTGRNRIVGTWLQIWASCYVLSVPLILFLKLE